MNMRGFFLRFVTVLPQGASERRKEVSEIVGVQAQCVLLIRQL